METVFSKRSTVASSLFLLLVTTLPYRYGFYADVKNVLEGLLKEERFHSVKTGNRVAVGFGSCWDVLSNAESLFDRIGMLPPSEPKHHDTPASKEELAEVFAYFFQHGAASERFMANRGLFEQLVSASNSSQFTLGGNGPVMAQRLAKEGWDVLLAAKMGPKMAGTLHDSIELTVKVSDVAEEDIHLLLEYERGDQWGGYTSPRANRFILHSDQSNMMLESLDGWEESVRHFAPSLVVVGGLQMLDNFPFNVSIRTEKLKELQRVLMAIPPSTKIHFEMASFSEESFLRDLLDYVIPYSNSLGMNEQELANLHSMVSRGHPSLITDHNPRIAQTLDRMRSLQKHMVARVKGSHYRKLTRLHVHTLAYQAIMTTEGAGWKHTRAATAKASLTANRHVCGSVHINLDHAHLMMDESFSLSRAPGSQRVPLVDFSPVACWYEKMSKICVAPNLVCTAVNRTASAGDNISAAGLSLQIQ